MKKGLTFICFLLVVVFVLPAFSLRENPQDPPRGKKRHISLVKVEDGKEMKLDTVIEGDNVFVWKGDTVGGKLKWVSEDNMPFGLDSLHEHGVFEYDIHVSDGDEGKKVIMFKSGDGEESELHEFLINEKDGKNVMFFGDNEKIHEFKSSGNAFWIDDDGNHTMIHSSHAPKVIAAPAIKMIKKKSAGNVIDLSDPGIISYKKKKMSDGREKIEIIRKEVPEEIEEDLDIIIEKVGDHSMIHSNHQDISKNIKIIKKNGNTFTILEEDGEELEFTDEDGNLVKVKEIKKGDGNIIHIEEIKEGDVKKVKVTVTKEVKKEKEEK